MIRKLISGLLFLPQMGAIIVGVIHLYNRYIDGADGLSLLLLFGVYFVIINVLQVVRMRIADPYNPNWYRPKTPKPEPVSSPIPSIPPQLAVPSSAVPEAPVTVPSRSAQRKPAVPPLVCDVDHQLTDASPAMSSKLQAFVNAGQAKMKDGE